jgi:hypothetical protein
MFIDPFVSTLRHSCDSNAWSVFNSKGVQVRATKDIPAGDEITLSFVSNRLDYEERTSTLKKGWGIVCNCSLCQKGVLGPTGELRKNILSVHEKNGPDRSSPSIAIANAERAIAGMKANSFDNNSYPMLELQKLALWGYSKEHQEASGLKTCLIMHFLTEPSTTPAPWLNACLSTLSHILYHAAPPHRRLRVQRLPGYVDTLMLLIHLHLREILVEGTARYFGVDSLIAKFELKRLSVSIKEVETQIRKRGKHSQYIFASAKKSDIAKQDFMKMMNELLKWADIPERTYEQLMP